MLASHHWGVGLIAVKSYLREERTVGFGKMIEKRNNPRIQINDIHVIFKQQTELGSGIVRNMSTSGALLRTSLKINKAPIEVLIKVPPFKIPFHATGKVVWRDEQEYSFEEYSFGIQFHSANKNLEEVMDVFSESGQHPEIRRSIKRKYTDKISWWQRK